MLSPRVTLRWAALEDRRLPATVLPATVLAAAGLMAGLAAAAAHASEPVADADAILKRAFDNYRANSSRSTVAMTVHRVSWERHLQMKVWTRGEQDALVRFTEPQKDAGNATLKLGHDIWVFNPRLNQVIQLPVSMMAQAWMGSDFSYDDLSKSEDVLTQFTHRLLGTAQEDGRTVWSIEAFPKPEAPVVWGKITLRIRDDDVILEEGFFDQDLKIVRRLQTDKLGILDGRSYPLIMTMYPSENPGQWTRVETSTAEFNVAIPDYLFTLSNLQNPRP
ncbi:MAG TPA: outer membrane lipoprotein-sorting protein [Steroidobacteraceae bacterium]|nr:outer membrane lipoprotein-sorting protein [Steroidobacteraceae bacterium]